MGNITNNSTFPFEATFENLSKYVGVSTDNIAVIFSFAFICMTTLGAYMASRSRVVAIIATTVVSIPLTFMGFMPFWMCIIYALIGIGYIFIYSSPELTTEATPSYLTIVGDYWAEYGNKLKLAYASKFGGENSGFNEEVDTRIAIMQNNGRGFTRAIAKDWLKRMERFTEAKKQ